MTGNGPVAKQVGTAQKRVRAVHGRRDLHGLF